MEEAAYAVAPPEEEIAPARLQGGNRYRDAPFAIAFLAHVLLVAFVGITEGVPALNPRAGGAAAERDPEQTRFLGGLLLVSVLSPLACCLAAFWYVGYIKTHAKSMVECLVVSHVAILFVAAGFCAVADVAAPAVLFLLLALVEICWYGCIRDRIPFMAAHLECACEAVQTYPAMVWCSVGMLVPQVLWVIFWCLCVIKVYTGASEKPCSDNGMIDDPGDPTRCCEAATNATIADDECVAKEASDIAYLALLASFYWGAQVFANVVHTTCCGVTGAWWFQPYAPGAVKAAFRRAMTTSFGSICLGSLVVAALKTVEYILRDARENPCLLCVIACVRSLIEYFNRFAYVYVALYGFDFRRAGSAVFTLFRSSGWTVIIHDDLLGIVLLFGALACGVFGAVIGVAISAGVGGETETTVAYAFVGLLTGLFAAQQVFCVIDSAFATVLVAWAEEPAALRDSRPSLYAHLYEAWAAHRSDLFETAKSKHPGKYVEPSDMETAL